MSLVAKGSEFSMHVQHTYASISILKFDDDTINCLIFYFLTLTDFSMNLTSKIIVVLTEKNVCVHKHARVCVCVVLKLLVAKLIES